jgi:hypothetical protein
MQAHDRRLPDWFDRIRTRQITLPRFQRFTAWNHGKVGDLLTTVLRGLPAGASLILEVGDAERFKSRTMYDAPQTGERVTEQLLDGQQRLTALWRSLHDKYPDRTYLIGFATDEDNPMSKLPFVDGQARWHKNGGLYPIWVDNPHDCWQREWLYPLADNRPFEIAGYCLCLSVSTQWKASEASSSHFTLRRLRLRRNVAAVLYRTRKL